MLCERCKIREANIQYTEIANGVRTEHNYCAQCAKEMDFGPYSAIFEGEFPLGKLLSGLLGVPGEEAEEEKTGQIICPTCGTSYDDFVKNSRFGCADCYSVFDLLIHDKIRQLQGNVRHTGKHPKFQKIKADPFHLTSCDQPEKGTADMTPANREEQTLNTDAAVENETQLQIRKLEARLREAVRAEEYEIAAECRDQIRALKEAQS
ncbi:MAG: UvrB/UvrC motif-containing protein [Lachnospiraceae bacterium]